MSPRGRLGSSVSSSSDGVRDTTRSAAAVAAAAATAAAATDTTTGVLASDAGAGAGAGSLLASLAATMAAAESRAAAQELQASGNSNGSGDLNAAAVMSKECGASTADLMAGAELAFESSNVEMELPRPRSMSELQSMSEPPPTRINACNFIFCCNQAWCWQYGDVGCNFVAC